MAYPSGLHQDRVAAVLGAALGAAIVVCFLTGLLSHLIQHPPSWFRWPSRPAGLYRVTQGVHVVAGIAAIPLVFAKLWTVYPKLFVWPPFEGRAHLVERVMLVPLIAATLFQLFTGLANINLWYPWPFNFLAAHFWVAWIAIGALVVHGVAKWPTTRAALVRRAPDASDAVPAPAPAAGGFDRRTFLGTVFATSGLLTVFTVGQTFRPLERLALLAPRRPNQGPQGFAVNKSAAEASVINKSQDPGYRLTVEGNVARPLRLSRDELAALPQREAELPIACVEGWSTTQRWRGVPLRDLLDRAGAASDAEVTVESLQRGGSWRSSDLNRWHAHDPDTLLALEVGGEVLHIDHGFPVRLIGPNRPGVMQTKWVSRVIVR